MEKCPHPDCDYIAEYYITKHHCRIEHGMTKEELISKYGKPKVIPGSQYSIIRRT